MASYGNPNSKNPLERDLERVGLGLPGLPALPFPGGNGGNGGDPRTPVDLVRRLPDEVSQTVQTGVDLLTRLPGQLAEDLTTAVSNLVKLPRELGQELFQTPGILAQRLAPSNINKALATVRDSADFKSATNPKELREKMRTITDVVDLFTPT